jgi:hypothetical protein
MNGTYKVVEILGKFVIPTFCLIAIVIFAFTLRSIEPPSDADPTNVPVGTLAEDFSDDETSLQIAITLPENTISPTRLESVETVLQDIEELFNIAIVNLLAEFDYLTVIKYDYNSTSYHVVFSSLAEPHNNINELHAMWFTFNNPQLFFAIAPQLQEYEMHYQKDQFILGFDHSYVDWYITLRTEDIKIKEA